MHAPSPTPFAALAAEAALQARRGDLHAAAASWRAALAVAPAHAAAWHNLGVIEARRGRLAEAVHAFGEAAALQPAWAEPLYARGHAEFLGGSVEAAALSFEAALARDPDHLAAHVDLAMARIRQQRYSLAIPHLAHARALAPADEAIWWTLRGVLLALGRDEDALADFRRFEPHAAPSARVAVAALASARRLGDASYETRALARVLAYPFDRGEAPLVSEALALVQYFDVEPAALLGLYDCYDRLVRADRKARRAPQLEIPAPDEPRLCVGYLSADFRGHVMGELLVPIIEAHDRARHRVTLFCVAPRGHEDAVTARFRAAADAYVELAALDDDAAAGSIAAAGIDVLVDLMGHSAFARPALLAGKPARRIVTHLGYHGAVGLASVDAKITDPIADLPDGALALREDLLPLDVCVLPLRPYSPPGSHYDRAALGIAADAIVIATFVPAQKLSPRCLALWHQVLDRVRPARLLFSPPRDDDRAALARRLAGFGFDAARVAFVPCETGYRADRYALADLALDTLPYTGGDTTAAALAAGVPVVTRAGARHAERMSASILVHAGLGELVADTDDAFVDLACRLATDEGFRADMRARVRSAFTDPVLCDPVRYARALEDAYARVLRDPPRSSG